MGVREGAPATLVVIREPAPAVKSDGPTRAEYAALQTALEGERAARAQAEAEFQRAETLLAERATELQRAEGLHRLAVEAARELSLTVQRGGLPAEELASLRAGLSEAHRARARSADERDVAGGRPDHGDASAGEEGGEVREQGVIREARAKGRRRCLAHVV